jgi:hypothetical protein
MFKLPIKASKEDMMTAKKKNGYLNCIDDIIDIIVNRSNQITNNISYYKESIRTHKEKGHLTIGFQVQLKEERIKLYLLDSLDVEIQRLRETNKGG